MKKLSFLLICIVFLFFFDFSLAKAATDREKLTVYEELMMLSAHVYDLGQQTKPLESPFSDKWSNHWPASSVWNAIRYKDNLYSGLTVAVYENTQDKELVVAFGGTTAGEEDNSDFKSDLKLLNPWADSYLFSDLKITLEAYVALLEQEKYKNEGYTMRFTGHSLGGAMAQFAGLEYGFPTITFNTAPMSLSGNVRTLFSPSGLGRLYNGADNIINFRSANDYVSTIAIVMKPYSLGGSMPGKTETLKEFMTGHKMATLIRQYNPTYGLIFPESSFITQKYNDITIQIRDHKYAELVIDNIIIPTGYILTNEAINGARSNEIATIVKYGLDQVKVNLGEGFLPLKAINKIIDIAVGTYKISEKVLYIAGKLDGRESLLRSISYAKNIKAPYVKPLNKVFSAINNSPIGKRISFINDAYAVHLASEQFFEWASGEDAGPLAFTDIIVEFAAFDKTGISSLAKAQIYDRIKQIDQKMDEIRLNNEISDAALEEMADISVGNNMIVRLAQSYNYSTVDSMEDAEEIYQEIVNAHMQYVNRTYTLIGQYVADLKGQIDHYCIFSLCKAENKAMLSRITVMQLLQDNLIRQAKNAQTEYIWSEITNFLVLDSSHRVSDLLNSMQTLTGFLEQAAIEINEQPVIISNPTTTISTGAQYTYRVLVDDPDDDRSGLSFSLTSAPSGMTISTDGIVSWSPGSAVVTSGQVTISVSDGGENGSTAATQTFVIAVNPVNNPPLVNNSSMAVDLKYNHLHTTNNRNYRGFGWYDADLGNHTGIDQSEGFPTSISFGRVSALTANGTQSQHDTCGSGDCGMGNSVIIEHLNSNGQFIHSLYAHLNDFDVALDNHTTWKVKVKKNSRLAHTTPLPPELGATSSP